MDNENDNNNVSGTNVTDNEQTNTDTASMQNGETITRAEDTKGEAEVIKSLPPEPENEPVPPKDDQSTAPKTVRSTTSTRSSNNSNDSGGGYQPMDHVVRARLATIRENTKTGWKRLLTVTQWGGGKFKLDVRDWNPDMTRATKGMTFTRSEAMKLRDVLAIIDLSIIDDYQQNDERSKNSDTMLKAS